MATSEFTLLGDAVWLDFVNSARGRDAFPPDLLPDGDAYARWSLAQELDPGADVAFPVIRAFRDQLTALAETLHAGLQPPGAAIAAINTHLGRYSGSHQLTRVNGSWRIRFAPARPLRALEAIARSAAATLADPAATVRRCAGATCSLFFTDATTTGSRRWCDPSVCGSNGRVERRRGMQR
ncbi:MAG TPA: CGNR zinc finger domain-containing protein [Gemmatimonadales bacterium]|nr:CGNR zinc finger domain-containing protein [Gemmatimonadales bacterium]